MAAAFEMHEEIGRGRVQQKTHELARQCKEGLAGMGNVTLYTPMEEELSAGMVCFDVAGLSAEAVTARLRNRGIVATASPYTPSFARLSPCVYNTPEEMDRTLAAVRDLA
jgi:isopenicillin-N epimerase